MQQEAHTIGAELSATKRSSIFISLSYYMIPLFLIRRLCISVGNLEDVLATEYLSVPSTALQYEF